MLITGIIGYPLRNTLSPILHNAAYTYAKLQGVYLNLPVKPVFLRDTLDRVRTKNFRGVNVTSPYKESILEHVDATNRDVQRLGATNTIIVEDGQLHAYNTDAYGFTRSLQDHHIIIKNRRVLLIGTGGASRACASVVAAQKPRACYIASRDHAKAKKLSALFNVEALDPDLMTAAFMTGIDVVINATTIDLYRNISPLMASPSTYYDLNYCFRSRARTGITAVNGLSMLVHQAARSFFLWTGIKVPVDVLKVNAGLPVPNHANRGGDQALINDLRTTCHSFKKAVSSAGIIKARKC